MHADRKAPKVAVDAGPIRLGVGATSWNVAPPPPHPTINTAQTAYDSALFIEFILSDAAHPSIVLRQMLQARSRRKFEPHGEPIFRVEGRNAAVAPEDDLLHQRQTEAAARCG